MNQRTMNVLNAKVRREMGTAHETVRGDKVICRFVNGKFEKVAEGKWENRPNFVIVSHFGAHDWSGFRTLAECLAQEMPSRPDMFYAVVER